MHFLSYENVLNQSNPLAREIHAFLLTVAKYHSVYEFSVIVANVRVKMSAQVEEEVHRTLDSLITIYNEEIKKSNTWFVAITKSFVKHRWTRRLTVFALLISYVSSYVFCTLPNRPNDICVWIYFSAAVAGSITAGITMIFAGTLPRAYDQSRYLILIVD
jgi:hypothetical protein